MQAVDIRRIILERAHRAHVGHIGSALCVADLLAVLYADVLRVDTPDDPDRDRFILSMGHASLALYATLFLKGWIGEADLDTYCGDGTSLGTHPEYTVPGIDFSAGSLGQGLCIGAGAALAARLQRSARRVFVLLSDGECNEGSTWEAVMFAAHHRLANLVAVVAANGQQAFGRTRDVLDLSPLPDRWRAFGWDASVIDGHDDQALSAALSGLDTTTGRPTVLIANTISGKGVSFMEGQIKWHYWPMSDEEYAQARRELREVP